jgi:hypothetical protein
MTGWTAFALFVGLIFLIIGVALWLGMSRAVLRIVAAAVVERCTTSALKSTAPD